ncbi:hypothetical protein HPB48_022588 [Haemaphysalis longicornis]|uniref:Protein hunchback n=1 Tax=Haemaphysalis longicornis TaxID=44386 RepID=A0A9J6GN92_HAELO|nr:hypothetical protein HPB48_022588 [Haemaphysalis longicornis]
MRTCETEEPWPGGHRGATMAEEDCGREPPDDASCGEDSDSNSTPNVNHLAQLQSALQKTVHTPEAVTAVDSQHSASPSPYRCHMCPFQGRSKSEYNGHMATHLDHKCPMCDYSSRTEGRLKRHVKDFHSDDQWQGLPGAEECKDRTFRCRQCGHVAASKTDFWEHSKVHIRTEKLLTCPRCPFVTEYKHHLEYHLRNHFGSKPFKCPKCNYSCVNKSMLNSHLKSHSNVYQYRCADCNYATKYCHSLKLHLRKYVHRPAGVLNSDGSPHPFPVLDVYGTRRGPRRGPRDYPPLPAPPEGPTSPALQELGVPAPPNSPLVNLLPAVACAQQQQLLRAAALAAPGTVPWKCSVCDFTTADEQQLSRHVLGHAESQDLCRLYGIRSLPAAPPPPLLPPQQALVQQQPQQQQQQQQLHLQMHQQNQQQQQQVIQQQPPQMPQQPQALQGATAHQMERSPAVDVPYVSSTSNQDPPIPPSSKDEKKGFPLDLSRTPTEVAPRSRRKGRAIRIDKLCMRLHEDSPDAYEEEDEPATRDPQPESAEPSLPGAPPPNSPSILASRLRDGGGELASEESCERRSGVSNKDKFRCVYCDIAFEHCVMYSVHMGYHGYHDPFTCNMCGQRSEDKLSFFLHIARAPHL